MKTRRIWPDATAAAIVLCALLGVGVKMGVFQGRLALYQLRYFTTLSNLLAAACMLRVLFRGRGAWRGIRGLALLCVLVTAAVYHALLSGSFGGFPLFSLDWWADNLLHTLVPALMLLDYLCFEEKGGLRWYHPLAWMLAPCGYFALTVAIAKTGSCFPNSATPYPYPFLDVWGLGWGPVLRNILALTVVFLLLGCALVCLDKTLSRRKIA